MPKLKIFSLLLLICAQIFFVSQSEAESLDDLQKAYSKLRNNDVAIDKRSEWIDLSEGFERALRNENLSSNLVAYFELASIYYRLGTFGESKSFAEKAQGILLKLKDKKLPSPYSERVRKLLSDLEIMLDDEDFYPNSEYQAPHILRVGGNPKRDALPRVVIDAGHGGDDFGAVGEKGLYEKDITLEISQNVVQRLNQSRKIQAFLTRNSDQFVPLVARTQFANNVNADLFISVHVNSSPKGDLHGLETYYLDNANDESSKILADRENFTAPNESDSGDLDFIVSDLIQSVKTPDSIRFANLVHQELIKAAKGKYPGIRDLKVKKAPFYVLVGAHMPCVLLELFFVNNQQDAKYLRDPKFRSILAEAVAKSAKAFLLKGSKN